METTEPTKNKKAKWVSLAKIYSVSSGLLSVLVVGYFLLLAFPQVLFAHSTAHGHFSVYSNEPIDHNVEQVLDNAEKRLQQSPLYDPETSRRVFLTSSHGMYTLLSHKAYRSFGNSVPFLNNVIINRSDAARDLVFIDRPEHNQRSLSGVIAHEITHLFIRDRYGSVASIVLPKWKVEGYCEYVAGSSTLTYDEGVTLWRSRPNDETGYQYFKFHMMVKYALEHEGVSVDDLFKNELNYNELAEKTLSSLR